MVRSYFRHPALHKDWTQLNVSPAADFCLHGHLLLV